jgi:hypothetical protein
MESGAGAFFEDRPELEPDPEPMVAVVVLFVF